jgi:hypothetical protein
LITHKVQLLIFNYTNIMTYFRPIAFKYVPIGKEFLWGGANVERSNWGRKRSSRTADYRPKLQGKLSDWTDWGYFRSNELVYVEDN